ncbi:PO21 protein, partial [Nothoprocta ornata]|nr:PO21 protein [Nothoprocta pentlandii]NWY07236.1 PO21 protein [Nothoprocta ornata]
KAFDTVSHQHILHVLTQKGVDKHTVNTIRDLYTNCGTTIKLGGQCSERIRFLGGVKQGDPLSPLLFNLVLDPLLCSLERRGKGYRYGEQHITSLAIADDLVLLSDSWEGMCENVVMVEDFCHQSGLQVQAAN